MSERKSVFDELNAINVNGKTEIKKSGNTELTYLSWPWAWAEVKKRFEDASYTIWKDENNRPYILDPETGYMVYTTVTIGGVTHEMWLPVMDGANKAMRNAPYKYTTKYNGEKTCEAATMMDINKTIMRCLVKNLAMFGLGLYIYAGEDLPEEEKQQNPSKDEKKEEKPVAKENSAAKPAVPPVRVVPDPPAVVEIGTKVPDVPKKETPKAEKTPVQQFLITAMKGLREARGITPAQNNKLFNDQWKALIERKLAPDKALEEYTMEEAEHLIDGMWKCFSPEGTKFIEGAK